MDRTNMTPPKEVIPADVPVPEYIPVDGVPTASPVPSPVGGDISTRLAQPEAMYAEISTRSTGKL